MYLSTAQQHQHDAVMLLSISESSTDIIHFLLHVWQIQAYQFGFHTLQQSALRRTRIALSETFQQNKHLRETLQSLQIQLLQRQRPASFQLRDLAKTMVFSKDQRPQTPLPGGGGGGGGVCLT